MAASCSTPVRSQNATASAKHRAGIHHSASDAVELRRVVSQAVAPRRCQRTTRWYTSVCRCSASGRSGDTPCRQRLNIVNSVSQTG